MDGFKSLVVILQDVKVDNLEPITPPEPVSFWPPQPGWYVVIGLLIVLLVYGIYRFVLHKKRNAYRKRALSELEKLNSRKPDRELIADLNTLLKLTALKGYPRTRVAGLTGTSWLEFLEQTGPKSKFSQSPGTLLTQASFVKTDQLELEQNDWAELIRMSRVWITSHKGIST